MRQSGPVLDEISNVNQLIGCGREIASILNSDWILIVLCWWIIEGGTRRYTVENDRSEEQFGLRQRIVARESKRYFVPRVTNFFECKRCFLLQSNTTCTRNSEMLIWVSTSCEWYLCALTTSATIVFRFLEAFFGCTQWNYWLQGPEKENIVALSLSPALSAMFPTYLWGSNTQSNK